jgi:uncharacterized protein
MFNQRQSRLIAAVLDTSVIIAGYRSTYGASREIIRLWREEQQFQLILSDDILIEWTRVLLNHGVTEVVLENFIAALHTNALLTDNSYIVYRITEDPSDNVFLAAALEGQAQYVVSLDRHLLSVKYYHGTQIVRPNLFLHILRGQAPRV